MLKDIFLWSTIFGFVCFFAANCGESTGDNGTDSGPDADTDSDTDTDSDSDGDTNQNYDSDPICDEWNIGLTKVAARLMILQDISGSMVEDENYQPQIPPTKWDQAESALTSLLSNDSLNLDFGFNTFPSNDTCRVRNRVISDTIPDNGDALITRLDTIFPEGGTPLYLAMKRYTNVNYAERFLSPDAASYLLVVSDGADTCGLDGRYDENDGATPNQLATLTGQLLDDFGVKTFVIGFGKGTNAAQLNAIASAGGTGLTSYIDAKDGAELEAELFNIASSVVSCVYDLNEQTGNTVDMNKVNFYFDDAVVAMDPDCGKNTGWTWVGDTKTRVEFCQAACDQLQSGSVTNISATFGCQQVIVE